MELSVLIERFRHTRENKSKAIFSTIFIAGNRLQTVFDQISPDITLKQFMLLTILRQAKDPLTFTQLGTLLGCSRQNIKKLAVVLKQKGFVEIRQKQADTRAAIIEPTPALEQYFEEAAELHQQKLGRLFACYSDSELEQLFCLLMKLYQGIDDLEGESL